MTSAAGRYPNPTTEAASHVSSLIGVHDVLQATRARFFVSVVHSPTLMPTPNWVEPEDHLRLGCQDVVDDHPGQSGPQLEHVHALIAFAHRWNRRGPLVIHCMAGISRSTAAAYVTLCSLNPGTSEDTLARSLREASPSALPNRQLVALGDTVLDRQGRMNRAIAALDIGAALSAPARPFSIPSTIAGMD